MVSRLAQNGVAAGDVTSSTAILWVRPLSAGTVRFDVALDPAFTSIVASVSVDAPGSAPIHATVGGLAAGVRYYYRAVPEEGDTLTGRFATLHDDGYNGLTFGVSGDWRGGLTPYAALGNADDAELDFFVQLGDTIYADVPSPAFPGDQARTLDEFRLRYDETLSERGGANPLADLRSSTSVYAMIDDHEVTDDFAGGAPPASDPRFDSAGADFINETQLYTDGLQAFHDYQPIERRVWSATGDDQIDGAPDLYRARTFDDDAAMFMVDARTFRDQPLADADVTNPADVARFLTQSFDAGRSMLGEPQLDRLKADLLKADAGGVLWKFVMVPQPIQNLGPAEAADRFEGYAAERNELLKFIDDNDLRNVVFVTADLHGTSVNNLTYQASPFGPQIALDAFEIITGSVAAPVFGTRVANLAAQVGLLTPQQLAFYNSLPVDNDPDSLVDDKDDFIKALIDQQLANFGYDPVGLNANLAATDGLVDATLLQGDYVALHTFGWTRFDIDPVTHELLVTTYGVAPYNEAAAAADPGAIAARTPAIVSQFRVAPDQTLVGDQEDETLLGGAGDDRMDGAAGDDELQAGLGSDLLEGGRGNDRLFGGGDNDIFLFDNRQATGRDRIGDLDLTDFIVTTVRIRDSNDDGLIDFGGNDRLDLRRGSSTSVFSDETRVTRLEYDGSVVVEGVEYFLYSLPGSSAVFDPGSLE